MKLTAKPLAAIVIAIMFGGIFFSSALGLWQTESTKVAATYIEGEYAGQANPADIRGSYTFGDVEKNFKLPAEILVKAFGVKTEDPAAFQVKSLEEIYAESPLEVGTASVRLFVAFYLGLPIDLSTDMYLPEAAAVLLQEKNLSVEQKSYLETHTIQGESPSQNAAPAEVIVEPTPVQAVEATPTVVHAESTSTVIKGKTMFADLLAWGVKAEIIEQVLGKPLPAAPGMTIKDFCTQNGLDFETIKPALQSEVDKLK